MGMSVQWAAFDRQGLQVELIQGHLYTLTPGLKRPTPQMTSGTATSNQWPLAMASRSDYHCIINLLIIAMEWVPRRGVRCNPKAIQWKWTSSKTPQFSRVPRSPSLLLVGNRDQCPLFKVCGYKDSTHLPHSQSCHFLESFQPSPYIYASEFKFQAREYSQHYVLHFGQQQATALKYVMIFSVTDSNCLAQYQL